MHVVTFKKLKEFRLRHNQAELVLRQWFKVTENATWHNLSDVRLDFRHADNVGVCTVFNVKGNDYRLITFISYEKQKVYVLKVMTHKEYDKGTWKDECDC